MNWLEELNNWFDDHHQEGLDLCAELIKQDTTNPPGNEYLATRVVAKFLDKYQIDSQIFDSAPGRSNLLAAVGQGSPVIFVPAHTDVVPVGKGWDHDPFEMQIKDGYLYGRGVNDNKGPLVSALLLAAFLAQHTDEFNGTFLLGAVADEEAGSDLGLTYLLENNLVKADYAVVPDTGCSIHQAISGEKGMLQLDLTFHGQPAHASSPDHGLNAILASNAFINKVMNHYGQETGFLKEAKSELFSPTTINISKIEAGNAYNIVPAECKIGIDCRFTPPQSAQDFIKKIEKLATEVQEQGLCHSFETRIDSQMEAFVVDPNSPIIDAIKESVAELTGKDVVNMGMSGTTVSKQLIQHNIPAIGFSQDAEDTAHKANERLAISEIPLFGKALGLTFLKLIKAS